MVGRALTARLGQTVVVENQGGAGGTIGARNVANAAPDGYTLMMIAVANTFGTQPLLYKLDFDPLKAFTPVATVVTDKQVMVANPSLPVKTARELVPTPRPIPASSTTARPSASARTS